MGIGRAESHRGDHCRWRNRDHWLGIPITGCDGVPTNGPKRGSAAGQLAATIVVPPQHWRSYDLNDQSAALRDHRSRAFLSPLSSAVPCDRKTHSTGIRPMNNSASERVPHQVNLLGLLRVAIRKTCGWGIRMKRMIMLMIFTGAMLMDHSGADWRKLLSPGSATKKSFRGKLRTGQPVDLYVLTAKGGAEASITQLWRSGCLPEGTGPQRQAWRISSSVTTPPMAT